MSKGRWAERPVAARPQAPRPIREARPICIRGSPFLIGLGRSAGVKPGAACRGGDVLCAFESHAALRLFASWLLL